MADPVTFDCVRDMTSPACASAYDPTPPPAECPVGSNYTASAPYRRVTGTECINEMTELLIPRSVPCPTEPLPPPAPVVNPFAGQNPFLRPDKTGAAGKLPTIGYSLWSTRTLFIGGFVSSSPSPCFRSLIPL